MITVTPNDSLDTVMEQFGIRDIDVFPVVDPQDRQKLLGMISRRDVITAYNQAILERKMDHGA